MSLLKLVTITKYPTRWYPVVMVAGLFSLLFFALPIMLRPDEYSLWNLYPVLVFSLIILCTRYENYISIITEPDGSYKEEQLYFHEGSYSNRLVRKVSEIDAVLYHTTPIARRKKGTIYFITNGTYARRISKVRYTREMLGKLIRDLREINPSIKLDSYTEALMAE